MDKETESRAAINLQSRWRVLRPMSYLFIKAVMQLMQSGH